MIIIGLTGSIASGKSTVSEIFHDLGAYIVDYDLLAREVVKPGRSAWQGIVAEFGEEILNHDSTINREKLGQIVFEDPSRLQTLNRITHPKVFEEAERRVSEIAKQDPEAIIIKDVPLLIETGIHTTVDKVVVVFASRETRIRRLVARGLTETEALKRIESQMPLREKVKLADFVIQNDGSIEETRKQVEVIYRELTNKS